MGYFPQVHELQDVGGVYTQLMAVLSLLAERGLVHCDCNEFNVLVRMLPSHNFTAYPEDPDLNRRRCGWYREIHRHLQSAQ